MYGFPDLGHSLRPFMRGIFVLVTSNFRFPICGQDDTLTYQNLLVCRVPINSILGLIIRPTEKWVMVV